MINALVWNHYIVVAHDSCYCLISSSYFYCAMKHNPVSQSWVCLWCSCPHHRILISHHPSQIFLSFLAHLKQEKSSWGGQVRLHCSRSALDGEKMTRRAAETKDNTHGTTSSKNGDKWHISRQAADNGMTKWALFHDSTTTPAAAITVSALDSMLDLVD